MKPVAKMPADRAEHAEREESRPQEDCGDLERLAGLGDVVRGSLIG